MTYMSELVRADDASTATSDVRILLYSDDPHTRDRVKFAVGQRIGERQVTWFETATHVATIGALDGATYDLAILDGEAAKSGGMGICRQLKHELYAAPPVLMLVGRQDDAWLATWSEADGAVSHPLDPFEVRAAVEDLLAPAAG